jgi:hypothetical protein
VTSRPIAVLVSTEFADGELAGTIVQTILSGPCDDKIIRAELGHQDSETLKKRFGSGLVDSMERLEAEKRKRLLALEDRYAHVQDATDESAAMDAGALFRLRR